MTDTSTRVNLARTVDRERKNLRRRSFDPLEWVEASTMVAAKLRVRSKLRVLSRLRCERTRSLAASVLAPTLRQQSFTMSEATLREQSFTASVLEHI